MKSKLYDALEKYFKGTHLYYQVDHMVIDIYIEELNLALIFNRVILGSHEFQILNLISKDNDFTHDQPKLYYEEDDFELLWNSLMLYINYNFDDVLWEKNIILP